MIKIEQRLWTEHSDWQPSIPCSLKSSAQVLFIFGSNQAALKDEKITGALREHYPGAHICGCSTAGEIRDVYVSENTLIATAVSFEHTQVKSALINLNEVKRNSHEAGARLAGSLEKNNLVHVFVISDGLKVNGSELARGIQKNVPVGVSVTGGLAGDGANFRETLILSGDGEPHHDCVAALGFYGDRLKVGYGSAGGWDPFGPERLITRSRDNVLYQIDGRSALELYKKYLGENARGLPATGLLFPLCIRLNSGRAELVRTVLSVDEKEQSMTFAGDIPQDTYTRFMKANFNRLIDGAVKAADLSLSASNNKSPDLAILISCVGRKLVLKQRVEEEVEGVREKLGDKTVMTGFYSYGEICPLKPGGKCELHNQTMTVTTLSEI